MDRYDTLRDYLLHAGGGAVEMTVDDVAGLVEGLPPSAFQHRAWWANDSKVQAQSWRAAGFHTARVSLDNRRVRFERG